MLLRTLSGPRSIHASLIAGLVLAFATPAAAGTVYSWVTEDGTYAFADSLKAVPKAYRPQARQSQMRKLRNYPRHTPSASAAKGDARSRLEDNLARYRSAAAPAPMTAGMAAQVPSVNIRTSRGGQGIQLPLTGQGVVEVEKVRTQLAGDMSTRHYTIIRQGGEVIAVFKGQDNSRTMVEVDPSELLDYRAADDAADL